MRSSTPLWLVVIAAVTILVIWMIFPNNPGLFGHPIEVRPGLDIQGGLRILLAADAGVQVDSDSIDRAKQIIENRVNALGVAEPVIQVSGSNRIVVELPGVRDPQQAIDLIKQTGLLEFVDFSPTGACTAAMPQAGQFIYTSAQAALRKPTDAATGTVTATGTLAGTSVTFTAQPTTNGVTVTVAAPATATTAAASTLVPTTAVPSTASTTATPTATPTVEPTKAALNDGLLMRNELYARPNFAQVTAAATSAPSIVPTNPPPAATLAATSANSAPTTQPSPAVSATPGVLPTTVLGVTPNGTPVRDGASKDTALINPCTGQPFTTIMTGSGLAEASAQLGNTTQNPWIVNFTLKDNEEGKKFGPFTGSHINQPMAIVLDGQVLSAPVIQARLDSGGQITGGFDQQRAKDLSLQLRYGALPVPLVIESQQLVGASLGAESVAATARAGILGVGLVLLYMIVYYRVPGVVAAVALLLFAAINFALYKFIPVTLTLPAITGFLISVGTAVDGNILIFERVREELRAGRVMEKAIDVGFSRAWPSIRDSNISTIIIAFILYFFGGAFGASAVRGFAITLIIGLVVNLFTAVLVTRTLLDVVFHLAGDTLRKNKWMIGD